MSKVRIRIFVVITAVLLLGIMGLILFFRLHAVAFSPEQIVREHGITINGQYATMDKAVLNKNLANYFTDEDAIAYFHSKIPLPYLSQVIMSPEEQFIFLMFGDENPIRNWRTPAGDAMS